MDIGVFDENHSESHGREILMIGLNSEVCSQDVNIVINKLNGNKNAQFKLIPSLQKLTQDKLKNLRIFADDEYEKAEQDGNPDIDDLKINLIRA